MTERAITSLVSAGTEMLAQRGELAAEDELGLATSAGSIGFPVKYTYQVPAPISAAIEIDDPAEIGFDVAEGNPSAPRRASRACRACLHREVREHHDQFVLADRRRNLVANSAISNNQQPMTDGEQFLGL